MGRKRRGGILLMTLVILAVCLAVLATTAANQDVRTRTTINRLEISRARLAAESGIRRAVAALATQDTSQVLLDGDWYQLGNRGSDQYTLASGDTFRLEVVDAASLFNLNTASQEQLLNAGLTTEQADSLLDWREQGTTPRTEGAKDEYYNNLDTPYNAKLGRLDSIDELLLIKGFDPTVVYQALDQTGSTIRNNDTSFALYQMVTTESFSPNLNANGEQKGDINAAQANQLQQSGVPPQVAQAIVARRNGLGGQFTTFGQVFETPGMDNTAAAAILDNFALGAGDRIEGKINLNTASESVLQTIPGITPDVASSLLSRQTSGGYAALSEILDVPGIDMTVLAQSAGAFATGSDTFLVRVIGTAGQTSIALEGVVRVENGQPILLKMLETPLRDMRTLWNWEDEATNEVEISG